MSQKQRLSASVDTAVMAAAHAAVAAGRAANVSAWVNEGLHRQAEHDHRMQALDDFLLAYESKHGVITEAEMADANQRAQARAVVVRGKQRPAAPQRQKPRSGAR
jgi:hypothetical protein